MQTKDSSHKGSSKDPQALARDEILPGFIVSSIISGIPFLGLMITVATITGADQIGRLVQQLVTLLAEGLCIAFFWRRIDPSGGKNFATATFAVGIWAFMGGCLITVFGLRFGGMGDLARNVALLGGGVIAVSGFFFAIAWAQSQASRHMVQTHSMIATSVVLAGFTALLLKGPVTDHGTGHSNEETLSAHSGPTRELGGHHNPESPSDHAPGTLEASHHNTGISDQDHLTHGANISQDTPEARDSHGSQPGHAEAQQEHHVASSHGSPSLAHHGSSSPKSATVHHQEEDHEDAHHGQGSAQHDDDEDSHGGATHDWSYEGHTNPATWGQLKPAWKTCSRGREQSPIDVPKNAKEARRIVALSYDSSPIQLTSNGEFLSAKVSSGGHAIINGKSYSLKRLDFHAPSEHRLGGVSYPLEIQFVHEDTKGHTAIISTFVEKGPSLPDFGKILAALPIRTGLTKPLKDGLAIDRMLPREFTVSAHQYMGSLTTPPCTEGVLWTVLKKPIRLGGDQLAAFSSHFAGSNRPTQPLGKRSIGVIEPPKTVH